MIGKEKAKDVDRKMISEYNGPIEFKRSNAINKYIRLYDIINTHVDFSHEYEKLIEKHIE